MTGDLGRMGEIPFDRDYGRTLINNYLSNNYTVNYTNDKNYRNYTIFSFGDSFSDAEIAGYQNYIGHILGDSVLNVRKSGVDAARLAVGLLNAGFFDAKKTKFVVIQRVERHLIDALLHLDFDKISSKGEVTENSFAKRPIADGDTIGYRAFNFGRISNWVKLKIGWTKVKEAQLGINAFSQKERGNKLYFYQDDLNFARYQPHEIEQAKANLIRLHEKFAEKGVCLIYVVAADKYDVYSEFIVNNPYPENHTLDYFSDLSQENWFLNTKDLLQPKVREGCLDVYKINDTHWSYIGHRLVAEEIVRRMSCATKL
ncbi:hypothetical protein AGMMS49982_00030 [Bacteroidia bacterium]|nr:hypothetical protein AGMMS49982_00030 [Bacteroidia bacterium]